MYAIKQIMERFIIRLIIYKNDANKNLSEKLLLSFKFNIVKTYKMLDEAAALLFKENLISFSNNNNFLFEIFPHTSFFHMLKRN